MNDWNRLDRSLIGVSMANTSLRQAPLSWRRRVGDFILGAVVGAVTLLALIGYFTPGR